MLVLVFRRLLFMNYVVFFLSVICSDGDVRNGLLMIRFVGKGLMFIGYVGVEFFVVFWFWLVVGCNLVCCWCVVDIVVSVVNGWCSWCFFCCFCGLWCWFGCFILVVLVCWCIVILFVMLRIFRFVKGCFISFKCFKSWCDIWEDIL